MRETHLSKKRLLRVIITCLPSKRGVRCKRRMSRKECLHMSSSKQLWTAKKPRRSAQARLTSPKKSNFLLVHSISPTRGPLESAGKARRHRYLCSRLSWKSTMRRRSRSTKNTWKGKKPNKGRERCCKGLRLMTRLCRSTSASILLQV